MTRAKMIEAFETLTYTIITPDQWDDHDFCSQEIWVTGQGYGSLGCDKPVGIWENMDAETLKEWYYQLEAVQNSAIEKWHTEIIEYEGYYEDEPDEFWISCCSEKIDAGITVCLHRIAKTIDDISDIDVRDALSDAYWENHEQFEDGLSNAEVLLKSEGISWECAILHVFGHFAYYVNEEITESVLGINADEFMLNLLGA